MVRWLEANGYDVSYFSGVDTDRFGAELLEHRVFLSVGHDEYWSAAQRANVEAARAAGVHLAFFSGNEVFWKTRWESSISSPAVAHRTLVSYKETQANAKIDPSPEWTGTWRDPRFSPPADGGRPENALTGTIFTVTCCSYTMTVPAADGRMRFWRNTSVASLCPARSPRFPTARSATNGTRIWTTASGRPAWSASLTRRFLGSSTCRTTDRRIPRGLPITRSRCTGTRAARSCSAQARCSGRGGSTATTMGRRR